MSEEKIKILVVDDEKTHIDVLVGLLSGAYRIVVAQAGASDYPVVIRGESGTGKELAAHEGTLFLDELGELRPEMGALASDDMIDFRNRLAASGAGGAGPGVESPLVVKKVIAKVLAKNT